MNLDLIDRIVMNSIDCADQIAVYDNGNSYSYKNIIETSRNIASSIYAVKENARVAIITRQGIEAYVSMIGTLLSGGFYCPINKSLPKIRQQQIIDNFSPDIIITDSEYIHSDKYYLLNINSIPTKPQILPKTFHDLAYVIFTSGSTGQPKGVMIKRSAVSKFIDWAIDETKVSKNDIWGQFSNIGFDLSVMDLYTALGGKATLVAFSNNKDRLFPSRAIKRYGITIWHSVPSVIDLMDRAGHINKEYFNSLRLMSFCGEPLRPQQLKTIFSANPNITVFNTYGPTEGTVFCTWLPLYANNFHHYCDTTTAIGSPIPGWNINLLGGRSNDEGEIVIWGENIGAGYWNNENETDKKYKVIDIKGSLYPAYYTGDWAEIIKGNMFFRHRIDHQVKINGYRVELDEIDYFIREFGISNSRTISIKGKIVSFLEINNEFTEDLLLHFLQERLPSYSLPSRFIAITKLPRNHNAKIDIQHLIEIAEGNNK